MSFTPIQITNNNLGRRSSRSSITPKEATATATRLLTNNSISPLALQTVHALSVAGVLTTHQLQALTQVSFPSLKRYHLQHLVDHLVAPKSLTSFGFPNTTTKRLRLYTLGLVGQALAEYNGHKPVTYAGYGQAQITHDVLCNQVVIGLIQYGQQQGYTPAWHGKYEARVYGIEGGQRACILEPDALLIFTKRDAPKLAFAIEYHNEDHRGRASDKVDRYERESRNHYWRETWPLDSFPIVLSAFSKKAVADGYIDAIKKAKARGLHCRFLGKKFVVNPKQPQRWRDFKDLSEKDIFNL